MGSLSAVIVWARIIQISLPQFWADAKSRFRVENIITYKIYCNYSRAKYCLMIIKCKVYIDRCRNELNPINPLKTKAGQTINYVNTICGLKSLDEIEQVFFLKTKLFYCYK